MLVNHLVLNLWRASGGFTDGISGPKCSFSKHLCSTDWPEWSLIYHSWNCFLSCCCFQCGRPTNSEYVIRNTCWNSSVDRCFCSRYTHSSRPVRIHCSSHVASEWRGEQRWGNPNRWMWTPKPLVWPRPKHTYLNLAELSLRSAHLVPCHRVPNSDTTQRTSSIVLIAYKRNGAAYQALCLLRTSEMELLFNCQTVYCKESLATPPSLVLLTDDRSCMYTWNLTCGQPQRCIWSLSLRSLASYDVALALSRNNLLHTLLPLLLLLLRLLLLISVFIKIANLPW